MPGAQLLESGLAWYYIDGIRVFRSMNTQHIALIGVEIHLPDLRPSYELVPGHSVNLVHHLGCAYRRVSSANNLNCDDILLCMVQLAVTIPPPPGKPRDKSSPSPPGEFFPWDIKGVRQIKNIFSLIVRSTWKYVSFLARFAQMAADFKTTYFQGKTPEFVGD